MKVGSAAAGERQENLSEVSRIDKEVCQIQGFVSLLEHTMQAVRPWNRPHRKMRALLLLAMQCLLLAHSSEAISKAKLAQKVSFITTEVHKECWPFLEPLACLFRCHLQAAISRS